MKLFGKTITIPKLREKFKGGFVTSGTTSQKGKLDTYNLAWKERCAYYDTLIQKHSLAKSCVNTIAGQVMAEGLFLKPVTDDEGKPYPRTRQAKTLCDQLNEQIGLDTILYDSAVILSKFGSVFWEKSEDPFDVRLVPKQENIEPSMTDELGNITVWTQKDDNNRTNATWTSDQIIHISWNVTSRSWPYGTSLLEGLETEFDILEQLETDIKEYMHKNAFPKEMFQVGDGQFVPTGDDITAIKTKAKNWEPGEYLVTSYPIKHEAGGTGDREVRNLNDVLAFIKANLVDGLMTPPVSFQYSSTYASSKEMMTQQRANLIVPMQRLFKRKLEKEVYMPYLVYKGFSEIDTPSVSFENAEAHQVDVIDYYTKGVASKIFPPRWAARQLGVPAEEYEAWVEEQQEKMEKQAEQKQNKAQNEQSTGDQPNAQIQTLGESHPSLMLKVEEDMDKKDRKQLHELQEKLRNIEHSLVTMETETKADRLKRNKMLKEEQEIYSYLREHLGIKR